MKTHVNSLVYFGNEFGYLVYLGSLRVVGRQGIDIIWDSAFEFMRDIATVT